MRTHSSARRNAGRVRPSPRPSLGCRLDARCRKGHPSTRRSPEACAAPRARRREAGTLKAQLPVTNDCGLQTERLVTPGTNHSAPRQISGNGGACAARLGRIGQPGPVRGRECGRVPGGPLGASVSGLTPEATELELEDELVATLAGEDRGVEGSAVLEKAGFLADGATVELVGVGVRVDRRTTRSGSVEEARQDRTRCGWGWLGVAALACAGPPCDWSSYREPRRAP